jgi:hypothetical protein
VPLLLVVVLIAVAGGAALVWWVWDDEAQRPPSAASPVRGWPEAGASRTVTQVEPDGVLKVTHWIHADRPLDTIELALPAALTRGSAEAEEVEVLADGRAASGPRAITSFRASYVFPDEATRVLVRYQLTGAVELSTSAPGRGLATVTALDVSAAQPRDFRIVRSHAVLALACATSRNAQPAPCGERESDDQWRVRLADGQATTRVLAVVTLS